MDVQEKREEIKEMVGDIILSKPTNNEMIKELRKLADIISD